MKTLTPHKRKQKKIDAQNLLVKYLNKNLNQIAYTFWLSVFVMIVGFGILAWGITKVFDSPDSVLSAAIASGAGVITEFIGTTFLFIYRSAQKQAEQYFKTLERISTCEIAGQIVQDFPLELRNKVKAEIAQSMVKEIYKKQ